MGYFHKKKVFMFQKHDNIYPLFNMWFPYLPVVKEQKNHNKSVLC